MYGNKFIQLKKGTKQPLIDHNTYIDNYKEYDDVAVKLVEPYVLVDVDDEQHSNRLVELLELTNINYGLMKTDRGYHFWFTSPKRELPNLSHFKTCVGVVVDYKSYGKKHNGDEKSSYAVIKRNGIEREWIKQPEQIDEIPTWLIPIRFDKNELPDFTNISQGERHQYMLACSTKYKIKGLEREELYDLYMFVAEHILNSPVDENDIRHLTIDNEYLDNVQASEKLTPLSMSIAMLSSNHFYIDDHNVKYAFFKDRYVLLESQEFESVVDGNFPESTSTKRKECIQKIGLELIRNKDKYNSIEPLGKHEVVFKNCILDMYTLKTREISPKTFYRSIIPHNYNPDIQTVKAVDDVLKKVTVYDDDLVTILLEMIAYSMCNHNRLCKSFILHGQGKNGKSVFLSMIRKLFVETSAVHLSDMSNKADIYDMVGKMVNVVDELGESFRETATYKSIVEGSPVNVKLLYSNPMQMIITCKLISATNTLPKARDKSEGYSRRLCIIPFDANFSEDDVDYDPHIKDKVLTEEAIQYLIVKAVRVYKNLMDRNELTHSDRVELELEEHLDDINSAKRWLSNKGELMIGQDATTCYFNYKEYCEQDGYKELSKKEFEKVIDTSGMYAFVTVIEDDIEKTVLRDLKNPLFILNFFRYENLISLLGVSRDELYRMYKNSDDYNLEVMNRNQFVRYLNTKTQFQLKQKRLKNDWSKREVVLCLKGDD